MQAFIEYVRERGGKAPFRLHRTIDVDEFTQGARMSVYISVNDEAICGTSQRARK